MTAAHPAIQARPEHDLAEGYRRLACVLRSLVGEQSSQAVLTRIARSRRREFDEDRLGRHAPDRRWRPHDRDGAGHRTIDVWERTALPCAVRTPAVSSFWPTCLGACGPGTSWATSQPYVAAIAPARRLNLKDQERLAALPGSAGRGAGAARCRSRQARRARPRSCRVHRQ